MVGENDGNAHPTTTSHIKDLIQLVKNGKMNKTDAFNELKTLLTNNHNHFDEQHNMENIPPPLPSPAAPIEQEESFETSSHTDAAPSSGSVNSTTPRFSKEDRRLLINKLIEKKRNDRQLQANKVSPQHRYDQPDEEIYDDEDDMDSPEIPRTGSHQDIHSQGYSLRDRGEEHAPFREMNDASSISTIGLRSRSTGTGYQSDRRRSHSAGTLRSKSHSPSYKSTPFSRRSVDDSKLNDYKNHKLSLQNDRIQQEIFKECTFTPKVKPLPVSIYGQLKDKDVQFYDRVMRWQREKELESTRRISMTTQTEVDGCTFHPKINKNSSRAVRVLRGNGNSSRSSHRGAGGKRSSSQETSVRLYESNAVSQSQRSKFIEEEKFKETKLIEEECTFQPRLLTKRREYRHVDPKYDKVKTPTVQELKDRQKHIPPPKDCTFTPQVKGVRNSMSSAKLYVKMDVVDRLTKPVWTEPPAPIHLDEEQYFDDRGVIDVASFMGSGSGYNTPTERRRPSSAPRDRRVSGGQSVATATQETEEEKEARRQSFQAFLGRQSQTKLRREKKTEDLIRHSEPSFQPDVNPRSLKMVRQSRKGAFLDRVQQDVLRREQSTTRLVARSSDPNHTFQPELSSRGYRQRSRSIYELSRGDFHKKETNQRILRLKTEQEELKNLTFQPTLVSNSSHLQKQVRSTLQLHDNPGGFLERHQLEQRQQEEMRMKILEEREMNELKECTFSPEIIECPQYVKRIARSLAVVKAAKSSESLQEDEKPQWR